MDYPYSKLSTGGPSGVLGACWVIPELVKHKRLGQLPGSPEGFELTDSENERTPVDPLPGNPIHIPGFGRIVQCEDDAGDVDDARYASDSGW